MLIDVHAHFYCPHSSRADWQEVNERRLAAGQRIGITAHVASILGTWGRRSPTYFPSPEDLRHANDEMLELQRRHRGLVFGYCVINPNYTERALLEIDRCLAAGMIGVKLAASRRANDPLLDPIAQLAGERGVPILHHIWQHRRRDWPGQEASDAAELAELAVRCPGTQFILAHLGGGGDWGHSLRAVASIPNCWVDLSGSGLDPDMIDRALEVVGPGRLLWGADLTLDTGWAKLRYLESLGLDATAVAAVRYANAQAIFPLAAFDADD
jgi:predicted TIM-barrel fold metal-dependent hydrolase